MNPESVDAWAFMTAMFAAGATGFISFAGWAFREAVMRRLTSIDAQIDGLAKRMNTIEVLANATVTHVELARSVDGLRSEIRETRLEIKEDVRQLLELMGGAPK